MIAAYQNKIEPHLLDGARFSHISLRGAASKINMQIMKIAANLHLTCSSKGVSDHIPDSYVESAIDIADALLEANLSLCRNKGLIGIKAEFSAILALFERDSKSRSARTIVMTVHKTKPFCEFTGSKTGLVKKTLGEMVKQGLLVTTMEGRKTMYHVGQ